MRKLMALVLALLMALGCCATALAEDVVLKMGVFEDAATDNKAIRDAIATFEAANPGIKVELEAYPGDFFKALENKFIAKQSPDVFYLDIAQFAPLTAAEKVEPLDAYIAEQGYAIDDVMDGLKASFTAEDGKLYGIAKDYNALCLFYNTKLFEDAGLTPPTTYDELVAAAKALTKDGVVGLSLQNETARWHPAVGVTNGAGRLMQDGAPVVNTPEAAEALDLWRNLFKDGIAQTPADMGEGWDGDAFGKGKAAMTFEGGWMCKYLMTSYPDVSFGVVEIPQIKQKGSMLYTVAYAMSAESAHKTEAFKLIAALTSADNQRPIMAEQNAMPSLKSLQGEYAEMWPAWAAFTAACDTAVPYEYGIASTVVIDELNKALEAAKLTDISSQDALNEAQAQIDAYLADQ